MSIPCAVSAIRGGALPSRGSGVTVLVTNASSCRATSGAASASRQPLALRILTRPPPRARRTRAASSTGPFEAEPLERAVDLDDAAVAGAVAARHRRLPRELRRRAERGDRVEHRLRAAGEDVEAGLDQLGDEHRIDHDLGAGQERGRLGVLGAAEAEDDRRRAAELLGEVRQRRDADPAADEQRPLDVEPVAVPERPEHADLVAGPEPAERLRPRPDRVDEEGELAGRREAERERPRQQASREPRA